ncbi:MAG TPA: hypothetical protein PKK43_12310 [Spirochaetota bacterium]|nr:hypothetical protein [Spirochaetota bacterium]
MRRIRITIFHLFLPFIIAGGFDTVSAQEMPYAISRWEIAVDEAVKKYIPGKEHFILDIDGTKDYDNNVYNHLISSNPDIKSRIKVIRSKGSPFRDLLFLDNKLYEILEYKDNVDTLAFKELFVSMKNEYGIPEMTKEKECTVYSYRKESTQVVLIAKPHDDRYQVRVYLYSKSLFRRMFED